MTRSAFPARQAAILGIGATRAGLHPGKAAEDLGLAAFKAALADAGIEKHQVEGVLGAVIAGSGINAEAFSALVGLNPKVTAALTYATSAFTLHYAAMLVATGACDIVACVYARNPPGAGEALSGPSVYNAAHGLINANAIAALGWSQHMATYGSSVEDLAHVAVAARKYAQINPDAAFREPLTFDDYMAQEFLIWPFRELDIAKTVAAGMTVIVGSREAARDCAGKPVYLEAVGRHASARMFENDDHLLMGTMEQVAAQVYGASGLTPADIEALYIYDATTAVVLQTLENYGFCGKGECGAFVRHGRIDPGGALALNTYGGHLSGGYLFGWLHHVDMVRQMRGEAGAAQLATVPRIAQYCTTGGAREHYSSTIFVTE
jgi:acetyl-CoA acetyltransferase